MKKCNSVFLIGGLLFSMKWSTFLYTIFFTEYIMLTIRPSIPMCCLVLFPWKSIFHSFTSSILSVFDSDLQFWRYHLDRFIFYSFNLIQSTSNFSLFAYLHVCVCVVLVCECYSTYVDVKKQFMGVCSLLTCEFHG